MFHNLNLRKIIGSENTEPKKDGSQKIGLQKTRLQKDGSDQKVLFLQVMGEPIKCNLYFRKGLRRLSASVRNSGEVRVLAPKGLPKLVIEQFLAEKGSWLLKNVRHLQRVNPQPIPVDPKLYQKSRLPAKKLVQSRLEYFNRFYGFAYDRISIRNQQTRWGSCSAKGNLNFNYRILFLPSELSDYVVVHELCHLRELNHSPAFWRLVELTVPDYKKRRQLLRQNRIS
jgi:predicted metal-dependent hydrolase